MRENFLSSGLNSDQSYLINELCNTARHSAEAASRLGFHQKESAFYAANALKRTRRSDRLNAIAYPPTDECVQFDPDFMGQLATITERDLATITIDDSTHTLGYLLSRLSSISRSGLGAMIGLPQAELNAIRSRCTYWSPSQIGKAVSLVGGDWDIVNPNPQLLALLHDLAQKDRHLEQKIRLLSHYRASQKNISMILDVTNIELQAFSEYYLVDIYTPAGRTKHMNMKQRSKVYSALREAIDLSKTANAVLEPVDLFIAVCQASEVEGRTILQDLQHIMEDEADKQVQCDIRNFMSQLNMI